MRAPAPLRKGDRIAIISPASQVREEYVAGAAVFLREQGFEPVVFPHALGPADGNFAATRGDRLTDLTVALSDRNIKGILCARGGFGCCHLLDGIPLQLVRENPKWLIGFSDISALHCMMNAAGVMSLHSPMAKHLSGSSLSDPSTSALMRALGTEGSLDYCWEAAVGNIEGSACGMLLGGNLAVIDGLANTPYDIFDPERCRGAILFIEDIAEPVYKVDRILTRLYLGGVFGVISGLVVGQFTEYPADRKYSSMEEMISEKLREWGVSNIPVSFNAPVGHVDGNLPMVIGAAAELKVTETTTRLSIHWNIP